MIDFVFAKSKFYNPAFPWTFRLFLFMDWSAAGGFADRKPERYNLYFGLSFFQVQIPPVYMLPHAIQLNPTKATLSRMYSKRSERLNTFLIIISE